MLRGQILQYGHFPYTVLEPKNKQWPLTLRWRSKPRVILTFFRFCVGWTHHGLKPDCLTSPKGSLYLLYLQFTWWFMVKCTSYSIKHFLCTDNTKQCKRTHSQKGVTVCHTTQITSVICYVAVTHCSHFCTHLWHEHFFLLAQQQRFTIKCKLNIFL